METPLKVLLIIAVLSKTTALPNTFCTMWKEQKENLMAIVKSTVTTREEAHEALWSLFQMHVYEKKNPKYFIDWKAEKNSDDVMYPSLNVLGKLARSNGKQCLV